MQYRLLVAHPRVWPVSGLGGRSRSSLFHAMRTRPRRGRFDTPAQQKPLREPQLLEQCGLL